MESHHRPFACGNGGASNIPESARVASRFQRRLGDILVALVQDIRRRLPHANLCLGGGLFYNTYFNTRIAASGEYERVFVPPNPGNPGLAAGAALAVALEDERPSRQPSPFLGPEYTLEEIKATLDNCKLTYACLRESEVIQAAVDALARGELVGWFQGRMEWGNRALGNRSILANPFAPHVLENLNLFLKKRERYRAYGLSVCEEDAAEHFSAPAASPFMELEFTPLDASRFRHILPDGARTLRTQTIPDQPRRFRDLHKAFAAKAGAGVLVNTSFNGFHEPIVCSPRDAVRVFFGTGLDMLVLDRFLVKK
jgi:carbamoyltransferase